MATAEVLLTTDHVRTWFYTILFAILEQRCRGLAPLARKKMHSATYHGSRTLSVRQDRGSCRVRYTQPQEKRHSRMKTTSATRPNTLRFALLTPRLRTHERSAHSSVARPDLAPAITRSFMPITLETNLPNFSIAKCSFILHKCALIGPVRR